MAIIYFACDPRPYLRKILIAAEADINAMDNFGTTTLMLAAMAKQTEMVKLLIAAKADVNLKNKTGDTALKLAKDDDVIAALKAAGAK